jgi:Xaa-Pro aminopeptidase
MQIAPGEHHLARHARLRGSLREASLDALLVTSLPNVAYLTGLFASTAALLVGPDDFRLFIDGRYLAPAEARRAALDGLSLTLIASGGSFEEAMAGAVKEFSGGRIGIEAPHMTVKQHGDLAAQLASVARPQSWWRPTDWSKTSGR